MSAVVGAVLGAAISLAVAREHRWGIGLWISDFVKTSGFAGLCALAAALIAFIGISRQVRIARAALDHAQTEAERVAARATEVLDHQRATDSDRAWWDSFEWAAGRAIPADPRQEPLPYVSIVRTFEALAQSATNDVQSGAISGVMDAATSQRHSGGEETSVAPASDGDEESNNLRAALSAYVAATANTPAASSAAAAQLYELEVLEALRRLAPSQGLELLSDDQLPPTERRHVDALLTGNADPVLVTIKYFGHSGPHWARRIRDLVQRHDGARPQLIIYSAPGVDKPPAREMPNLLAIAWRAGDPDYLLGDAVEWLLRKSPHSDDSPPQ